MSAVATVFNYGIAGKEKTYLSLDLFDAYSLLVVESRTKIRGHLSDQFLTRFFFFAGVFFACFVLLLLPSQACCCGSMRCTLPPFRLSVSSSVSSSSTCSCASSSGSLFNFLENFNREFCCKFKRCVVKTLRRSACRRMSFFLFLFSIVSFYFLLLPLLVSLFFPSSVLSLLSSSHLTTVRQTLSFRLSFLSSSTTFHYQVWFLPPPLFIPSSLTLASRLSSRADRPSSPSRYRS